MTRLGLLALAVIGCGHGADDTRWQEVKPAGLGFRVEMPAAPKLFTKPTVELPPTNVQRFLVDRGARGSFQVATYVIAMKLEGETAEAAASLDCLDALKDSGYAIADQHAATLGTARGFAVTAESATVFDEQRCFVAGTRMFHLLAVGPNDAGMKADAQHFISTFALL